MVVGRSLTGCPTGIQQEEVSLTDKGCSPEDLAARVVLDVAPLIQSFDMATVNDKRIIVSDAGPLTAMEEAEPKSVVPQAEPGNQAL